MKHRAEGILKLKLIEDADSYAKYEKICRACGKVDIETFYKSSHDFDVIERVENCPVSMLFVPYCESCIGKKFNPQPKRFFYEIRKRRSDTK